MKAIILPILYLLQSSNGIQLSLRNNLDERLDKYLEDYFDADSNNNFFIVRNI